MTAGLRARFTHWLLPARPEPAGPVAVWLTRLQQDDNAWLIGERLEQQGRLADARRHYLQDADRQQQQGQHARAAIAHAASASVTARLGDEALARWQRERAAGELRLHAEQALDWSLREAAWAYARASSLYEAAGRAADAEEMRRSGEDLAAHVGLPTDGFGSPPDTGEPDAA